MQSLYSYLYARESRRGETGAWILRWVLAAILFSAALVFGPRSLALAALGPVAFNLVLPIFRRRSLPRFLPYLATAVDAFSLAAALLFLSNPETGGAESSALSPVLWLYFVILYGASMRFNESLIIFATVVSILGMNSVYVWRFLYHAQRMNTVAGAGLGDQVIRTALLLGFGLLLLNRPRVIRRILGNQQDFFDSVRERNLIVFENLDRFAREHSLSRREKEVMDGLVRGKTYRMIADGLFLSPDTVKSHVRTLYRKLDIKSRNELVQVLRDRAVVNLSRSDP